MDDKEMLFTTVVDGRVFGTTINPDDPGRWLTKAEFAAEKERRRTMSEIELAHHRWVMRDYMDTINAKLYAALGVVDESDDTMGVDGCVLVYPRVPGSAERVLED